MSWVTVAQAREHLEVIGTDQDAKIQRFIDAAEGYAQQYMGRPLQPWESPDSNSSSSVAVAPPEDVRVAILMLVADYFENRTVGVTGTIYSENPAAEKMLHFHRKGLGV